MKKYVIKKGKHNCKPLLKFSLVYEKWLQFRVKFTESCLYKYDDLDGQDINKLMGFSDGGLHTKNSARIGWRCIDGKTIELFSFCHVNSKMIYKYMTTVNIDEQVLVNMFVNDDEYMIDVTDSNFKMTTNRVKRGTKSNFKLDYLLYPYFGGDHVAPHNIEIYIERYK